MTDLMWLFEYHALQLRERDWVRAVKDLTGANMLNAKPEDRDAYVPLAALLGNPEALAKIAEVVKDQAATAEAAEGAGANDFDQFSEWLMRASDPRNATATPAAPATVDADAVPLFLEPLVITDEQRAEARRQRPENIAAEKKFVTFDDD